MNKRSEILAAIVTLLFSLLLGLVLVATISRSESHEALPAVASDADVVTIRTTSTKKQSFGYEITSDDTPSTLAVGESVTVVGKTVPATSGVSIMWYSGDSSVAKVTLDGVITGVKEGKVTVTAVAIDPNVYNAPEFSFDLTVTSSPSSTQLAEGVPEGNRDLLVVSATHPITSDYVPSDLVGFGEDIPVMHDNLRIDRSTLEAYTKLYKALRDSGAGEVYVISAYRSYDKQKETFTNRVNALMDDGMSKADAEKKAALTVNPPGCSEHQLGNTIDLSTDGTTQHDFAEMAQGRFIAEHAHEYGFIVRYPIDKESITGIKYEPWHIRYVGLAHARYMYEHGLCLEEYILL